MLSDWQIPRVKVPQINFDETWFTGIFYTKLPVGLTEFKYRVIQHSLAPDWVRLFGSNDNKLWEPISEEFAGTWTTADYQTVPITSTLGYRWIKVQMKPRYGTSNIIMSDIRMKGFQAV